MFKELPFTLRLLSPAFVAGAMAEDIETSLHNQGVKPRHRIIGMNGDGLRITSLRGILRFWYRAKEGTSLETLAQSENAIFGGKEVGQGVRIIPAGQSDWKAEPYLADRGSAESYLGYGPLNDVSELKKFSSHNKFGFRDVIREGTEFSFLAIGTKAQIHELRKCLLLLHLFGGIGGRSRRGFGSVEVIADIFPSPSEQDESAGFGRWAERILEIVWPSSHQRPKSRTMLPKSSQFFKDSAIRYFDVPSGGYRSAMKSFYNQFRLTRAYNRNNPKTSPLVARDDHAQEWKDADSKAVALTKAPLRLAYGLPYAATLSRSTANERGIRYEGISNEDDKSIPITRRASPLFLKVASGNQGTLHGVALFLQSKFLRGDRTAIRASISVRSEHGKVSWVEQRGEVPVPNYDAIHSYLANSTEIKWSTISLP